MTADGPRWLTVPVVDDGQTTPIRHKKIANDVSWRRPILNAVHHAYSAAPGYPKFFPEVRKLIDGDWQHMADLAVASMELCFRFLRKTPVWCRASELGVDAPDAQDRLIALAKAAGGTRYLSGPSAKGYIADDRKFSAAGLELMWM